MKPMIRSPREFWAGVIYVAIGAAAIIIGRDYDMGTAMKMGPAYFPTVLGTLLAAIGAISLIRSLLISGPPINAFALKGLAAVVAGIVLFGVLARGAGLIVAIAVLVLISARASIRFHWGQAIALAAGLVVFSALIFVVGLGVRLPLFGPWLGG